LAAPATVAAGAPAGAAVPVTTSPPAAPGDPGDPGDPGRRTVACHLHAP
ncbi:ABC transporter ATP-binding protein, partial [Streptomyces sp. WAC04770]